MKTEELIAMLSTNVEPVDHRSTVRSIGTAVAASAVLVMAAVILALGLRTDLMGASFIFLLLKVGFLIGILVPASLYLTRLSRPGGERRTSVALIAVPFIALMLLAAVSLTFSPRSHWNHMVVGDQWLECLISIPLIAVAPFAMIIWAVRRAAPTNLARTGAFAGLLAGCLSAAGYALHCADDSAPFVALWYGGTIALCTAAGWKLGPRLLRW